MSVEIHVEAVTVRRYRCPFCGKTKARRDAAERHATTCHRNPDSHACSTCVHFMRTPCCDTASDDCGCKGLNACAVGAFTSWRFNDHHTKAPDPNGWWTHVEDWRRDCPHWARR